MAMVIYCRAFTIAPDPVMKHSWMILTSASIFIGLIAPSHADFVGLNIGAKHWTPDISGSFQSSDDSTINLNDDLGIDEEKSTSVIISFEHPIPLLPNIKFQGYNLDSSGSSNVGSITFDGADYSGDINSTLDLSHNDIVLYYELLDNWINLDLGLDLKKFDGKVSISDVDTPASTIDVDETIPMLYLSARFDLPFTGLYIGAHLQQLNLGDSSAEDSTLMIGYESKSGLGIEGGIKTFNLELDDVNDLNTDLEYDGIYLNGYFHF